MHSTWKPSLVGFSFVQVRGFAPAMQPVTLERRLRPMGPAPPDDDGLGGIWPLTGRGSLASETLLRSLLRLAHRAIPPLIGCIHDDVSTIKAAVQSIVLENDARRRRVQHSTTTTACTCLSTVQYSTVHGPSSPRNMCRSLGTKYSTYRRQCHGNGPRNNGTDQKRNKDVQSQPSSARQNLSLRLGCVLWLLH